MEKISKLRELLGAESGNQWIEFMDYVNHHLAHVLTRGKPSKEMIRQSIIGESGFNSWIEMIESPIDKNGLGWNKHAWDSWKRAYSIIQEYEYLRNIEITASSINTIHRETKPDFPSSLEDFKKYQSERESKQLERQQNSLKEAQEQVKQCKDLNTSLNSKISRLNDHISLLEKQLKSSNDNLIAKNDEVLSIKVEFNSLNSKIKDQKQTIDILKSEINKLKNRSLIDRIFNR